VLSVVVCVCVCVRVCVCVPDTPPRSLSSCNAYKGRPRRRGGARRTENLFLAHAGYISVIYVREFTCTSLYSVLRRTGRSSCVVHSGGDTHARDRAHARHISSSYSAAAAEPVSTHFYTAAAAAIEQINIAAAHTHYTRHKQ